MAQVIISCFMNSSLLKGSRSRSLFYAIPMRDDIEREEDDEYVAWGLISHIDIEIMRSRLLFNNWYIDSCRNIISRYKNAFATMRRYGASSTKLARRNASHLSRFDIVAAMTIDGNAPADSMFGSYIIPADSILSPHSPPFRQRNLHWLKWSVAPTSILLKYRIRAFLQYISGKAHYSFGMIIVITAPHRRTGAYAVNVYWFILIIWQYFLNCYKASLTQAW